jgi:hypothetical protein
VDRLSAILRDPGRRCRWFFGCLVAFHVALIWVVDVLPGSDLPQHLAYARIIMDYDRADLRFHEFYLLPPVLEPYHLPYYCLAGLGRIISLWGAVRVLMTLYVVGTALACYALIGACHRSSRGQVAPPMWSAWLTTALIWNPVVCMGFLAFALCMPFFIYACALLLRLTMLEEARRRDLILLLLCCAVMLSIHVVAAGCFFMVMAFHALLNFSRRAWTVMGWATAAMVVTFAAWQLLGGVGLGRFAPFRNMAAVDNDVRAARGYEFFNDLLKLEWSDSVRNFSFVLWNVLGPFGYRGHLFVLCVLVLGGVALLWLRRGGRAGAEDGGALVATPCRRALARVIFAFAIVSLLVPFGVNYPTEITYLNFRMMTLAALAAVALVPAGWFSPRRAQAILAALSVVLSVHVGVRVVGFSRESGGVLDLLREVPSSAVLLSLPFHNRTDYFGKQFTLSHFLPMYHTVRGGGINTQFWGRFSAQLPVSYQRGMQPRSTTDWEPNRFQPRHLADSDYVLLQDAGPGQPDRTVNNAARVRRTVEGLTRKIRCEGLWCLYEIPKRRGARSLP